jgi:hypothetical protein
MSNEPLSPWYTDGRAAWEDEVQTWLAERGEAGALGKMKAMTTLKERPWSVVRRVRFETGDFIFKACGAAGSHEPALLLFLGKQKTLPVPSVEAVDLQRGWLLLRDAGMPLREVRRGVEEVQAFGALLPHYAQMQISSLPSVPQLLKMGLPDRRLQRLPDLLPPLLSVEAAVVGRDAQAWQVLRAEARKLLPQLQAICRELGASEFSATLDHGDLHQGNVFVHGSEMRLGDWGDACITHPFPSLMVTLETVLGNVRQEEREAWAAYLRDAYLEPWQAMHPQEALQRDFERAMWLAHLLRALNFAHMFLGADEKTLNQWRPTLGERLEMWVRQDRPSR